MKSIVISVICLMSSGAFGAELNLNGGESAWINANVQTYVTCGGDSTSGSCNGAVEGLKISVKSCETGHSASYCIDRYWPDFKEKNSQCIYDGLQFCIEKCSTGHSPSYCADKCNN